MTAQCLKGIVSRDWEQIQWIPSGWSEECRVAGAYFFPFWSHFYVLIGKMHDLAVSHLTVTLRMKIILCYRCCTCMIHSSIGMLLPGWRTRAWCYSSDDCRHFVDLSAMGTVTSACLIYRQMSIDHRWGSAAVTHHSQSDLRLLLIICRVTVKWKTATACLFWIKNQKWNQKGIQICSGNPKFFRSITWMSL